MCISLSEYVCVSVSESEGICVCISLSVCVCVLVSVSECVCVCWRGEDGGVCVYMVLCAGLREEPGRMNLCTQYLR